MGPLGDRGGAYLGRAPRASSHVTAPADLDGDGDPDLILAAYDGWVRVADNPVADDADGDLLTDETEVCVTGTRPDAADTDGDGISDFTEVWMVTDPR